MIVKDAKERKQEILSVADRLFKTKGFDHTSISDILDEVGIARGTLYYHFKSKEDIMDSLIDSKTSTMISNAKRIAGNKSLPVLERFLLTIKSLNMSEDDHAGMIEFIHQPQNALINEKNQKIVTKEIPPILLSVVEDGIEEGFFQLDYPYEAIEMTIVYANAIFGNEFADLSGELQKKKILAFIRNVEVMFGAKKGTFDSIIGSVLGEK